MNNCTLVMGSDSGNSTPKSIDPTLLLEILNISGAPLFVKDRQGRFVLMNNAFCELLGKDRNEIIGKTDFDLFPAEQVTGFFEIDEKVFTLRRSIETEEVITDSNNNTKTLRTTKSVIETASGELLLVGTVHDISELRATQNQLESAVDHLSKIAHTDPLTGLSNRVQLERELEDLIRETNSGHEEFAVVFIDLNGFKVINDTAGHLVGDEILISCSKRLRNQLRGDSKIARVGGDEFLLLLPNTDIDKAEKIVTRIVESFRQPIAIDSTNWHVACSVGVTLYPQDGTTSSELIRNADFAMYEAKKQKRNDGMVPCSTVEFFRAQIGDAMDRSRKIERALNFSKHGNHIEQHYQPIVAYKETGYQICGFESLARWELDGKWISPEEFIPILDKSGGIIPFGYKAIESACDFISSLDEGQYVSVNLTYKQILDNGFCETVVSAIKNSGINPARLALELTEHNANIEKAVAKSVFEKLRRIGVRTMIDDFGCGYSNLGRIGDFPIDVVKIDKSLTHDARLLKSVLSLVRELGFSTIVEGIETEELAKNSLASGADMLQGYYFGHPQPASFDWKLRFQQHLFPLVNIALPESLPNTTPFG